MEITSETRRESYETTLETADTERAKVFSIIVAAGVDGLTAEEVATKLSKPPYQVRPRITELKKAGRIWAIGKKLSPSTNRNIAVFAEKKP